MADTKVTDLTADTTPTADDVTYVVNDPAGTPADRKVALGNLLAAQVVDRGQWAASTSYARGDIVSYGSHRFWRLGATFTSGTTFDPANWSSLDRLSIDNPANFAAATAYDQEFDGSTTSLPSSWGWVNQGSATYQEGDGAGVIISPAASGINWRCLTRSLTSAPSTWLTTMKRSFTSRAGVEISSGMVLRESSSGKLLTFYSYANQGGSTAPINDLYIVRWASPTDAGPTVVSGPIGVAYGGIPPYLRIRKNSSTSYDFEFSTDGTAGSWYSMLAAHNPTASMTPDEIGFGSYNSANFAWRMAVEFIRLR